MKRGMHFAVVSNVCFEPYLRDLLEEKFGEETHLTAVPLAELHDAVYAETMYQADAVIVLVNLDEQFPGLADEVRTGTVFPGDVVASMETVCRITADYLKNVSDAPVFWFTFEGYGISTRDLFFADVYLRGIVGKLNEMLFSLSADDITFLDLEYLIARIGVENSYDIRGKYRWNAPYSKALIAEMVNGIDHRIRAGNGETKKCVVVDCDNVLWGGIISEDGIEGIRLDNGGLGREYRDFQRYLKTLYDYGIILAVCSKNDAPDVLRVFREHSGMILREEHISCFFVNWKDKAENIREIAASLRIGLDSIVFVDDSVFEIQAMRALLPEVVSIQYNRKTVCSDIAACIRLNDTGSYENVLKRQTTYVTDQKRERLLASCASFEEYLQSLAMETDIHEAVVSELNRIAELTQRANQCTNGVRCSVSELKAFMASGGKLYAVCVKDRYSDLGLVGVIGITGDCLSLLVLSCRALGRSIEDRLIAFAFEHGARRMVWKDTGKNGGLCERMRRENMQLP